MPFSLYQAKLNKMARRDEDSGLMALWQEAQDGDEDGLRLLVEQTLQRVLEEELTALVGAEPHERTEARRGHRKMPIGLTQKGASGSIPCGPSFCKERRHGDTQVALGGAEHDSRPTSYLRHRNCIGLLVVQGPV